MLRYRRRACLRSLDLGLIQYPPSDLDACPQAEFGTKVVEVGVNGPIRDPEDPSDLAIRSSLRHLHHPLPLPTRQHLDSYCPSRGGRRLLRTDDRSNIGGPGPTPPAGQNSLSYPPPHQVHPSLVGQLPPPLPAYATLPPHRVPAVPREHG